MAENFEKLDPKNDVILRIDGVEWKEWLSFDVSYKMDAICPSFAFGVVEKWDGKAKRRPIAAGMPCEVVLTDKKYSFVTGYIDRVDHAIGVNQHSANISGRGKQCDLVDCAAMHNPGTWTGAPLRQIVRELVKPYGVPAYLMKGGEEAGNSIIPSFKLEEGETAFAALDRACKLKEALLLPVLDGGVGVSKLGHKLKDEDALIQGKNVLSASASYDVSERFSDYIVKGQKKGTDESYGLDAAQVRGEARDETVQRYRPMIVRAESQMDAEAALKRAKWEATVRAARGVSVTVKLQGWQLRDGTLWFVNFLVPVDLPYFGLKQDLLVSEVGFNLTKDGGTVTTLTLKDPKAFDPEPPKKEAAGTTVKKGGEARQKEIGQADADSAWSAHKEKQENG